QAGDAVSSMQRVQSFLMAAERQDSVEWKPNCSEAIIVDNAEFLWEADTIQGSDYEKEGSVWPSKVGTDSFNTEVKGDTVTYMTQVPTEIASGRNPPFSLRD